MFVAVNGKEFLTSGSFEYNLDKPVSTDPLPDLRDFKCKSAAEWGNWATADWKAQIRSLLYMRLTFSINALDLMQLLDYVCAKADPEIIATECEAAAARWPEDYQRLLLDEIAGWRFRRHCLPQSSKDALSDS